MDNTAKSIADKIDLGAIIMGVKEDDLVALDGVLSSGLFEKPTLKVSIYKNRRGKFKSVILWCKADLGTCRMEPMFMTDCGYEMMSIDDVRIVVQEEESAF